MAQLNPWNVLEPGGTVDPAHASQPHTGAWRTGLKPSVDLASCVNCLLCWLHCPDSAVLLDGTTFEGFDFDFCKGCEICEEVCPVGAIAMVSEDTPLPPLGVTS
jgi:2-oxoacid:acceptor oxidoreductase delta subunit (pyruvate/2-ketoisovalerate family)